MDAIEAIRKRRSVRRFRRESVPLPLLEKLIDAARLAPSAQNLQPLEFIIVYDEETVRAVFPHLLWAGYIYPAGNPPPGEEPTAYIIVLLNGNIRAEGGEHDAGAAIENILIAATALGIGTCWVGAVNRKAVTELLHIPDDYRIDSIVALGYPDESPVIEDFSGSIQYWKDDNGVLHVPKRKLSRILHFNRYGECDSEKKDVRSKK
ncbi:MAG: nitroreductase family protein [bacterium]